MALDLPKFRAQFPEFGDETEFPDAVIGLYYEIAETFVEADSCPCGSMNAAQRLLALRLMAAHLLALSSQSDGVNNVESGASSAGGIETSASIGEVSISKMQPPATDGWQFWLAQTPYGQQLWALLGLLSVGGLSVGGLPERTGFRKVGGIFA